jgi:16S rRNA (cytosine1402-N4)-methyltransferase
MGMIFHQPVLRTEVAGWLILRDNGRVYCDCTLGGGGHLLAMLKATTSARFVGLDWDPEAIRHTREILNGYRDRVILVEDNFINLGLNLDHLGIKAVDGILFDLGVSYHQLKTPARGFSYANDGPLTMQMSPANPGLAEKLNRTSRDELIQVLRTYGDVYNARKIGIFLWENRKRLRTTFDLRGLVEESVPPRYLTKNLHKVFQALRIWVNDEINNLRTGIARAADRLKPGGRIVVIAYHSGEDRVVKNFFREMEDQHRLKRLHKKVIKPDAAEVSQNPAGRSAKMRVAEKCATS